MTKISHKVLDALFKHHKISGYSGKKLDEKKAMLDAAGISYDDASVAAGASPVAASPTEASALADATPKVKKTVVAKSSSVEKILKSVKAATYSTALSDFKEEPSNDELLAIVWPDVEASVRALPEKDTTQYVAKYGLLKALKEYLNKEIKPVPNHELWECEDSEINELLVLHLLATNVKLIDGVIASMRKHIVKAEGALPKKAAGKARKRVVAPTRKPADEESEREGDDYLNSGDDI